MKIKTILLALTILFAMAANGQTKNDAEIKIKTSAECDMCKKRIESNLKYEKGVKFCSLDVASKVLTVTYNPEKTSAENIKLAINKLGYDADNIAADSAAYTKLPDCCKKGAHQE